MKFEDLERYMHEEHLRHEAERLTRGLMQTRETRRALRQARLQRAAVACAVLGMLTFTASAFMPAPRYDYARGNHASPAAAVCESIEEVYSKLKTTI